MKFHRPRNIQKLLIRRVESADFKCKNYKEVLLLVISRNYIDNNYPPLAIDTEVNNCFSIY